MELVVALVLSVLCLILFIDNLSIRRKNNLMKDAETKAKKEADDAKRWVSEARKSLHSVHPGDRVFFEYSLQHTPTKKSFDVTCEANVSEVCDNSVKVVVYEVTSSNVPQEMKQNINWKNEILDFMKDRWINRSIVSIIRDKTHTRSSKIDDLIDG